MSFLFDGDAEIDFDRLVSSLTRHYPLHSKTDGQMLKTHHSKNAENAVGASCRAAAHCRSNQLYTQSLHRYIREMCNYCIGRSNPADSATPKLKISLM